MRSPAPARAWTSADVIGGGARSDLWCDVLASMLDIPLRRVDDASHGPALGAARLAQAALTGRTRLPAAARRPRLRAAARAGASLRRSARSAGRRSIPLVRQAPGAAPHPSTLGIRFMNPDPAAIVTGPARPLLLLRAAAALSTARASRPGRRAVRLPLVRQGPARARPAHGGPAALRGVLLAQLRRHRHRPVRRRHVRAPVARRRRRDAAGAAQGRRGLRAVPGARRAVLHLPRPRHRARGPHAGRIERQRAPHRRRLRAQDGADRRAAAVGHGEPVLASALHGRRGDQSGSGGLRVRRRAGAQRARGDAPPRRRELRAVGRPRRLRDAAQHRPEARAGADGPLPVDGGRAQAQDRLQGPDPHRAQAGRADQAPVRLRRRHGPRLPAHLRPRERGEGQHRAEPRAARGPHLRARDRARAGARHLRLARHEPRRRDARLGHRPVPAQRAAGRAGAVPRAARRRHRQPAG